MQTVNVRIKTFPGNPPRPATTRVQLPKPTPKEREAGAVERPLEPGEVCEMPRDVAIEFLNHLEHELEMTLKPATRRMFFSDKFEAERTSESFRPGVQPRSEQVKEDVAQQRQKMAEKIAAMQQLDKNGAGELHDGEVVEDGVTIAPDDVVAAMALLKKQGYTVSVSGPEIEEPLVLKGSPETLVDESDDYEPSNNAIHPSEVDEERRKYKEEQAKEAAKKKPTRKRRKTSKPDDGPPPSQKRRRRGQDS